MNRVTVNDYATTLFKIYLAYTRQKSSDVLSPIVVEFVRGWAAEQDPPIHIPEDSSETEGDGK